MKKIELEIETYRYQLEEYLLSIDGITDVKKEERDWQSTWTIETRTINEDFKRVSPQLEPYKMW